MFKCERTQNTRQRASGDLGRGNLSRGPGDCDEPVDVGSRKGWRETVSECLSILDLGTVGAKQSKFAPFSRPISLDLKVISGSSATRVSI